MSNPNQPDSDFPKGVARPARRALAQAGYWRLEQLTALSEAEARQLHGVGAKALELLRQALEERGLSFAENKLRADAD